MVAGRGFAEGAEFSKKTPDRSLSAVAGVMSLFNSPNSRKHQRPTALMDASYNNSGHCRFWLIMLEKC